MQTLLGIVVGIFLTIGIAYVHDSTINPNPPAGSATIERPMVNWDVVAKNIDGVVALARDGWKKIAG